MGDLKQSKQAVGADAAHPAGRLRAADDRRPGGAPAVAPALLQPRRHQHPGPAVPALPAGPPDGARSSRWCRWPSTRRVCVGIMSYDGQVNFGLIGDYDAMRRPRGPRRGPRGLDRRADRGRRRAPRDLPRASSRAARSSAAPPAERRTASARNRRPASRPVGSPARSTSPRSWTNASFMEARLASPQTGSSKRARTMHLLEQRQVLLAGDVVARARVRIRVARDA